MCIAGNIKKAGDYGNIDNVTSFYVRQTKAKEIIPQKHKKSCRKLKVSTPRQPSTWKILVKIDGVQCFLGKLEGKE